MFPANAFILELFASLCFLSVGRKTSHWKTTPLLSHLLYLFIAAASLLHVPLFSVYAAPSLEVASFLFAVCPFGCSCWSPLTPILSLSHPSAAWSLLKPSPGSFQPWLPLLLLLRGFQTPLLC